MTQHDQWYKCRHRPVGFYSSFECADQENEEKPKQRKFQGTLYRHRKDGSLGVDSDDSGDKLPVDLAANAESLGAHVIRAGSIEELRAGLEAAKAESRTTVIAIEVDRYEGVPSYESWWDVPVAEVSELDSVREARKRYEAAR